MAAGKIGLTQFQRDFLAVLSELRPMTAIRETNFQLPGQTAFYRGKVRDV